MRLDAVHYLTNIQIDLIVGPHPREGATHGVVSSEHILEEVSAETAIALSQALGYQWLGVEYVSLLCWCPNQGPCARTGNGAWGQDSNARPTYDFLIS